MHPMTPGVFNKYLTPKEEKQFFAAISACAGWVAQRDQHLFKLLRNTGLRIGAATQLTVADAKAALASETLLVRDAISKRELGGEVPLNRHITAALKGLLEVRRSAKAGLDPDAPLVLSRTSVGSEKPMTSRGVQLRARYWALKAGLNIKVTPHWFRHTFGQRLMRDSTAENPLAVVAAALHHRSLSSTMIYTRPTREEVARAMAECAA